MSLSKFVAPWFVPRRMPTISMPMTSYTKSTRRRFRRRNRKMRRRRSILPFVMPNRYRCKLRYNDMVQLNPSNSGTAVTAVYRANDLYDPQVAIGGHQPLGFDQLCQFFNHFCVIGSKITVTWLPDGTGAAVPFQWGIALTDNGTKITGQTYSYIMEQEHVTHKPITAGYIQDRSLSANQLSRKSFFSLSRWFNEPKGCIDDQYCCDSGNSPAEGAYYEIWAICPTSAEGVAQYLNFTIEYIVVCKEPTTLAQS